MTRHLIVLQQIIQRCGFPDEVPDGTTERIHSTFLPHYVVLNLSYYILSWITETNATAPPSDSLEQGLRQMAVLKISRQNTGTQHAAQIGNGSTLIDFMTVLYTRWRFDNYIKDQEPIFLLKKFRESLFPFLSYIVQNSFHFDEIFHHKIPYSNFGLIEKIP